MNSTDHAGSNVVTCQDCPATMTRGNAHVRSVAFEQVFFCSSCLAQRQRFAAIVRGVCAELPEPMPLTRRILRATA